MQSQEYAQSIPRNVLDEQLLISGDAAYITAAQRWSANFGELLHDRLSNPTAGLSQQRLEKTFEDYEGWLEADFRPTVKRAESSDSPEALLARQRLNFHVLNGSMRLMWQALTNEGWPSKLMHSVSISASQESIALYGLDQYIKREPATKPTANYAYFGAGNSDARASLEGRLQEADAALILLEICKRNPGLTVVPAPLQFEQLQGKANANFIVVDCVQNESIGVQVKSRAQAQDFDAARIVIVDGSVDLDNVKGTRTDSRKSSIRTVTWAGAICAHYAFEALSKKRGHSPLLSVLDGKQLFRLKSSAIALKNTVPSDRRTNAIARIEERLQHKLHIS